MSELLNSIKEHFKTRPEQAKLTETRSIVEIEPVEIRDTIAGLYKEKDLNLRLLGTILNSIFTQHRAVFLFSRPILEALLKADPNIKKRKTINGDEFNNLMINLGGKFLVRLATPNQGEHRASVYKLSHTEILNHLRAHVSNEIIGAQEEQCLGIFNRFEKASTDISNRTSSGDGVDSGNALTCLGTVEIEAKKKIVSTSHPIPPERIENATSLEATSTPPFQPEPNSTPEIVEFQKLIWATKVWSQVMTETQGDYRRLLMGRKNRAKIVMGYVDHLTKAGCDLSEPEYITRIFENIIMDPWLKKDSESNLLLRKEVNDDLRVRIFESSIASATSATA